MQAGLNPLVVRRDHSDEAAHSLNTEFVSGNYFRTFALRPAHLPSNCLSLRSAIP